MARGAIATNDAKLFETGEGGRILIGSVSSNEEIGVVGERERAGESEGISGEGEIGGRRNGGVDSGVEIVDIRGAGDGGVAAGEEQAGT